MNMEFEENITKRGAKKRTRTENATTLLEMPKTPSRCVSMHSEYLRTPVHEIKCDAEQTPRRSARKSIKPAQDYEDIVIGRTLRSTQKEALLKDDNSETEERKWTPAKVGRVSQKRASRKSNRKSKRSKKDDEIYRVNEELDVKNVVNVVEETAISEEDNGDKAAPFANVETEDLLNTTFDKSDVEVESVIKTITQTELNDLGLAPIMHEADTEEEAEISANAGVQAATTESDKKDGSFVISTHFETDTIAIESEEINEKTETNFSNEALAACQPLDEKSRQVDASGPTNSNQNIVSPTDKSINASDLFASSSGPEDKISRDEMDEMPSLILCDEEDNEDIKNDTFNASDCIVISPTDNTTANKKLPITEFSDVVQQNIDSPLVDAGKKAKEIQTKYFNTVKTHTQTIPIIVVHSADNGDKPTIGLAGSTPKSVAKIAPHTPGSAAKRITGKKETPYTKNSKRGYKFNTPCKDKIDLKIFKTGMENTLAPLTSKLAGVTTLEPREIVLRSIRKRSLSVADGDRQKRKGLNVTFYSPANQTATTEDLDQIMAKGASQSDLKNQNKTKIPRRKRSISLDENALRFPSKLPRLVKTPVKVLKSPIKPTTRTKIPNFAAIHENQYKKMENIVDYVARKAERAQNLTNSALKTQNGLLSKSPRKEKPQAAKALSLATSNIKKDDFDKIALRRERHIAMFKGRENRTTERKLKNSEYIKGVRSNRHFELLMQHRKTSGN